MRTTQARVKMKDKITIKVPLADILSPYPETTAEKMEGELKHASKLVKRGVHRIPGEVLFKILHQNRILMPRKNNPSPQSQGTTKTQAFRIARREAAKETIKSVLTPDEYQSPKVIYGLYVEKAKSQNEIPYTYAWFRVSYGELRAK